jgi:hypothetical protein
MLLRLEQSIKVPEAALHIVVRRHFCSMYGLNCVALDTEPVSYRIEKMYSDSTLAMCGCMCCLVTINSAPDTDVARYPVNLKAGYLIRPDTGYPAQNKDNW